nr:unnamed protein product [uncultured bacterium]
MIAHFFNKFREFIIKCVSPPLVGVVLAMCSGLNVYAASTYTLDFIFNDGMIPDTILSGGQNMAWNFSSGTSYKAITFKNVTASISGNAYDWIDNPSIVFSVNGNEIVQRPISRSTPSAGTEVFVYGDISVPVYLQSDGRFRVRFWLMNHNRINSMVDTQKATAIVTINDFVFSTSPIYDGSTDNLLDQQNDLIKDQIQQDKNYHDQDKNDAISAGSDMQGMASDLETVKSKWEILWYPIEFTNKVMGAFQGSGSARYASAYADISGYYYNDVTGLLEPVMVNSRGAPSGRANSGTVIHIPAYTMPVLNVEVWAGADYDLSTLKEQFPVAFNLLYVVITVIEVLWFVGFLRDKYEEVFG